VAEREELVVEQRARAKPADADGVPSPRLTSASAAAISARADRRPAAPAPTTEFLRPAFERHERIDNRLGRWLLIQADEAFHARLDTNPRLRASVTGCGSSDRLPDAEVSSAPSRSYALPRQ
jgi:hypothetical protein